MWRIISVACYDELWGGTMYAEDAMLVFWNEPERRIKAESDCSHRFEGKLNMEVEDKA
jgi:hypothetical protein